jgi:hypothetical protein
MYFIGASSGVVCSERVVAVHDDVVLPSSIRQRDQNFLEVLTSGPDPVGISPGLMRFRVSFEGVCGVDDLVNAVATELFFPHEASGLDALLDLMSDLDWFGHDAGYVVEFVGLDQLQRGDPELLAQLLALLPNLCDRWRSRGIPFCVVLRCKRSTRGVIRDAIEAANASIEKAAKQPWLADLTPVEVIECVD